MTPYINSQPLQFLSFVLASAQKKETFFPLVGLRPAPSIYVLHPHWLFCTSSSREALVSGVYSFKRMMGRLSESEGQGCFALLKNTFPVVGKKKKSGARWPVVSLCYCADLTHQSEIKALTVANIKGLLLVCPVPRGFFLLSILIHCRSQGGSSPLIMKGRGDTPEPRQAWFQSIFILEHNSHQRQCSSGPLNWLKWCETFFFLQPGFYSRRILEKQDTRRRKKEKKVRHRKFDWGIHSSSNWTNK